jgi:hypothetical protein
LGAPAASTKAWESFLQRFGSEFKITNLGPIKFTLGVEFAQDLTQGTVSILQKKYIEDLLVEFGMFDCAPVSTPLAPNANLTKEMSPKTKKEKDAMAKVPYLQLFRCLMYLMLFTHPDLCHAVGLLSHFGSNPGPEHWAAAKQILRYLRGTSDYCITYR